MQICVWPNLKNAFIFSLDATRRRRNCLARYVNDAPSSQANAFVRPLTLDDRTHLCLFAKRHITENEEICYDYGDKPCNLPWRKVRLIFLNFGFQFFQPMCLKSWFILLMLRYLGHSTSHDRLSLYIETTHHYLAAL